VAAVTYADPSLVPPGMLQVSGAAYQPGAASPPGLQRVAAVAYAATQASPAGMVRVAVVGAGGQTLGAPTAVLQNTAATNDLSPDGYTWAPGSPLVRDAFGQLVAFVQRQNGGTLRHLPVVSGDDGLTWSEPTRTGFFDAAGEGATIRGAVAHDAVHDLFLVVWVATQAAGGVIFREYRPTRDGANRITAVTRVRGFQLEVGVGGMTFEAPVAAYYPEINKFVAGWSARTATKAEYRLSTLVVADGAADVLLATWQPPFFENAGAGATDTLASSGLVKYSAAVKSAVGVDLFLALCRKSAGSATHARDLCFAYVSPGGTVALRYNRAAWASGTSDWRGGVAVAVGNDTGVLVSALVRAGTDLGYGLKYQLISKIVEDQARDKLWVGASTWKSNTLGDTWTVWSVSGADAASGPTDLYEAGAANTDGARDIFVTGDVMWDAVSGYVVVAWTNLMAHAVFLSTLADGAVVQAAVGVFATAPCDIPTLYDTRIANKIAVTFRDFNAGAATNPPTYTPPYRGWYVAVPLG
jgi:hypothetical protein